MLSVWPEILLRCAPHSVSIDGGDNSIDNLVVLCPSCHRHVHSGAVSASALKKRRTTHLKEVAERLAKDDDVSLLQALLITYFISQHCIVNEWRREDYTKLPETDVYLMVFDFQKGGVIVNPADGAPIIVSSEETTELPALEMISSFSRLVFADELQRYTKFTPQRYYLVQADILSEAALVEQARQVMKSYVQSTVPCRSIERTFEGLFVPNGPLRFRRMQWVNRRCLVSPQYRRLPYCLLWRVSPRAQSAGRRAILKAMGRCDARYDGLLSS